ncbi:hypothetical protein MML48_5g00016168 [Holotrichia oblita]|uniref:Uncharacterized protein n=1 Tax=Holotrichia oblita TaxID=644536 RepID=A0ACB9T1W9_HOLOL|nr:hypothetical protein MML48_5g00016168 [Holotrichia oblita]
MFEVNFSVPSSYWKAPLTLTELIEEADEEFIPKEIVIFPPEIANNCETDEDSGDDDFVDINNVPGSQLRAPEKNVTRSNNEHFNVNVEGLELDQHSDLVEDEDDLPLSVLAKRLKIEISKKKNKRNLPKITWIRDDIVSNVLNWEYIIGPKNNMSPLDIFFFIL